MKILIFQTFQNKREKLIVQKYYNLIKNSFYHETDKEAVKRTDFCKKYQNHYSNLYYLFRMICYFKYIIGVKQTTNPRVNRDEKISTGFAGFMNFSIEQ